MPDNLSPQQRKYCMSRVKGKDTGIEKQIRSELYRQGYRFRKHVPGKPDIVFPRQKVAVFIDGDFWHGYRFSTWKNDLSSFWQEKILKTRLRDQRNFKKLHRGGWKVIRVWQHQIKNDLEACINIIKSSVTRTQ
jgi:DNA mismatch endonuclease (patch repair protein)